jgi:hypothetical protein
LTGTKFNPVKAIGQMTQIGTVNDVSTFRRDGWTLGNTTTLHVVTQGLQNGRLFQADIPLELFTERIGISLRSRTG